MKDRKISIIVVLAIVSLICILAVRVIENAKTNNELNKKYDELSASVLAQDEANAEKENMLRDENASKYLEDIAREDGYIHSEERVYEDSNK